MINDEKKFQEWVEKIRREGNSIFQPTEGMRSAYRAGWEDATKAAAKLAYSVNNHDEHMQWVIPTGPNSDRCGWCACLETIGGLLDGEPIPDGYTPGIHDNEGISDEPQ